MSVNYEWSFPQCDVVPSQDGLEQVVTTVHWRLNAIDGEYSAGCYGSVGLDPVTDPSNFTAFSALTKEQITEWVVAKINAQRRPGGPNGEAQQEPMVDQMKAGLAGNIENQKNPPLVSANFAFGG